MHSNIWIGFRLLVAIFFIVCSSACQEADRGKASNFWERTSTVDLVLEDPKKYSKFDSVRVRGFLVKSDRTIFLYPDKDIANLAELRVTEFRLMVLISNSIKVRSDCVDRYVVVEGPFGNISGLPAIFPAEQILSLENTNDIQCLTNIKNEPKETEN